MKTLENTETSHVHKQRELILLKRLHHTKQDIQIQGNAQTNPSDIIHRSTKCTLKNHMKTEKTLNRQGNFK